MRRGHPLGRTTRALAFLFAALTSFAATAQDNRVTVFAAASVAGALDDIAALFEGRFDARIVVSYAGTSALARQIERGAPADIFISADVAWMDHVVGLGLVDEAHSVNLVGNRLVLIAPTDAGVSPTNDLPNLLRQTLAPGRPLAMADVEAVPAGRYGRAALQSLSIWEETEPYVVQTDNVRTALAFVARGGAPLGIVYATDAATTPDVTTVAAFEADLHPPIIYPAALLSGHNDPHVVAFFEFLTGTEAAALFREHGFVPLAGD